MARQEDTCWNCGTSWDYRVAPREPLPVTRDRAAERPESRHQPLIPATLPAAV
jgi:hypothetical protein